MKTETMDYKYIEQLLARYEACTATEEEERILRAFFSQSRVPAQFGAAKDMFDYLEAEAAVTPGADFDSRLLALAGESTEKPVEVRARRVGLVRGLQPLLRAVAAVAVIAIVVTGAQHVFNNEADKAVWDYNINDYSDSYSNPQEAYETLSDGIDELREVLAAPTDSTRRVNAPEEGKIYSDTPQQ